MLTPWQEPLAMAASTPSPGWVLGQDGGELQRRATAWYAMLRVLPRRVRRALQRKLALPLMGVALLWALGQGPSHAAATWTVCASGCAYTTIQAAVKSAKTVAGDTIAVRDPVHTEAGITVTKDLNITGQGADTTVVQAAATPGTASDRVFTIASGVSVTIQALTLRHGVTSKYQYPSGGGVLNEGILTLLNGTVTGNAGGGLFNYDTLALLNSTVSGNTANWGGGLNNHGMLTLTNSTVSGNTADSVGGSLANDYAGSMTLINSTISGNAAPNGGGLTNGYIEYHYYYAAGHVQLISSLVARNLQGGDCSRTGSSYIVSEGYNLDSDGSCHLIAATDRPGTDPRLGPLQDNGGATLTHALLPNSPALDAIPWGTNGCGTTLFSDQRWQARPQPSGGACDIGAYEVEVAGQPLAAWVVGLTPHTAVCENITTGQAVTLNDPAPVWDCEAAGLGLTSGDQIALHVRGPVKQGATDVGGAVVGMAPSGGGCTNRTAGQQVKFQALFQGEPGATAASCVAAGLGVHPGDTVQMRVQGVAE